ncbi:hypothetical protein ABZ920_23065 [Streptomyces sp. NPDC046831]|uniref:hypothetical protein n=1 Tax=Streptomyces sp. NPDC046831 TaxID=3154805 RepID=UPI00340FACEE
MNADENLYEVTLYSTTYNRESTCYVYGSDQVTEPTRTQNYANTQTDRQRQASREMFDN